jgi:hypothetical protein
VYLRFPREHWHRIRHSNFIERTLGETSCVCLVWAVLDRGLPRGWHGFTVTAAGTRLLQDLRRRLLDPPTPIRRHARQIHQPTADAALHLPPRNRATPSFTPLLGRDLREDVHE